MPLTGLVLRRNQPTPLTADQGDGNWTKIRDFSNALEQRMGIVLKPDGTLKPGAVGSSDVIANGVITADKLAPDAKLPPGTILDFGGGTVPTGFLKCDGTAYSRTDPLYAALFAAIQVKWGIGDGSNTFNVPDLRRRVCIGAEGLSIALPGTTVGNVGGAEQHTLTGQQSGIAQHKHAAWAGALAFDGATGSTGQAGSNFKQSPANGQLYTAEIGPIDAVQAHNNMQPSAVVTKIIKL